MNLKELFIAAQQKHDLEVQHREKRLAEVKNVIAKRFDLDLAALEALGLEIKESFRYECEFVALKQISFDWENYRVKRDSFCFYVSDRGTYLVIGSDDMFNLAESLLDYLNKHPKIKQRLLRHE